ncbi:MAG: hypothetical protein ACXADY_26080 [Candidatus Hodarchaeales archaeon]
MANQNTSFTDRLKDSMRKMLEKEVGSFQKFDQEYKVSSHPLKRTFLAISELNQIHKGRIGIAEIATEANLSNEDVNFIIQEFIDQRLIDGFIEQNETPDELSDDILIVRQDYYFCQIDQMKHTIFELHFQCESCLRFICMKCYQKGKSNTCPYCNGNFIPVPRIFKNKDVETSSISPTKMKTSLSGYYQNQKKKASRQGIKMTSQSVYADLKKFKDNRSWSFSSLKEKTKDYWGYRKTENEITKHEKMVIDTISALYEVEESNQIAILRIAKIAKLEIELAHEIIRRLIGQQTINGFIESAGTYETISDDILTLGSDKFYCEIHDEAHVDPLKITNSHFQCTYCFRAVCDKCHKEMKEQGMNQCLFCGNEMSFFPGSS